LLLGISFVVWFGFRSGADKPPAAEVTLSHAAGRKPVVVMYFENQSGSAELDWLREGLADMLIASLSRSGKLAVLSRQQLAILLERSGHQQAKPIRLDEALEIARRTQAEVIALGSFAQMGERVRLDVQLHEARTGQLLTTESLLAEKPEQILSQVDLLSLKLAGHLGAAPAEPNQQPRLAEAMTDNLEAWRCYSLAVEKTRAFHSEEAIQLLEKAVALDAQFAMAYARLGQVYLFGGLTHEFDRARRYLERAYQLRPRLTERDRLYINFWYAYAQGEGADQVLRELIRQYPLDVEAYYHLSYSLRNQTRLEEAIEVIRQGLVIDPEAPDLYNRLGFCYAELGRYDEALAAHQRYVQLAPQEANAYDSLGMTCFEAGRYDQALAAFEQALALSPDFGLAVMHQGDVYARQGRYRTALVHYQRCLPLLSAGYHRGTAYNRLARLHLRRGALQQAAEAGRLELRNQSGLGAFLVALARGDLKQAGQLKAQYLNLTPTDSGRHIAARFVHYCEGLLALKSGRTAEALKRFEAALRGPVMMWEIEGLEASLANAYLELGRLDEAIAEYERLLRLNPRYALAHYHLGQAYERQGDTQQARAAYERFLASWKDADPDLPEVIAAQQRLTALR
jgi:tetratricopeptide (TPR) repeat protein